MADDSNPIESMTPGQILASADVAEFIKAMGLSIAEAQKALDVNSLSMLGEYVEPRPGLAGADGKPRSLVQLGLSPPFYHYQHADLTVGMQLMMKVGKASSFGIGGKLDFGLNTGGGSSAASARTAQVKLKKLPASVTVAATKTDAAGADLDAAAAALAAALRAPTGKFEQVLVNSTRSTVKAELDPGGAKSPLLTPGAVAFLPTGARSSALIRISALPLPNTSESFTLAANTVAEVASAADLLVYARKVVDAIKAKGFKARLSRDPGGDTSSPDAPGVAAIALFDTDSDVLKPTALAELQLAAELLVKGGRSVKVTGYADTRASNDYNKALGLKRAAKVAEQLKAYKVDPTKITAVESGGEERWAKATGPADNPQFRRVEVTLANSSELFVVVESDATQLQDKPLPDLTGGDSGNGFIVVNKLAAQAVEATAVKVGEAPTSVAVSGAAVSSTEVTLAADTPEAFAFNLAKAINAGSETSKVRASRRGAVVLLSSADDAVALDLVTLSTADFTLSADGGADVSKQLEALKPAGPTASKDKPNITVAAGITVDYRSSRQFEQSVNGNSSITARLVAVPAPIEFLDEIKKFLTPDKIDITPSPSPSPSPP
jgi:outer membrane protein OmpA-like peptidoglycan-associated protein